MFTIAMLDHFFREFNESQFIMKKIIILHIYQYGS